MSESEEARRLRARLAEIEKSEQPEPRVRWGWIVAAALALIAVPVLGNLTSTDPSPAKGASPAASSAPCSQTVSRLRIGQAESNGLVQGTDFADRALVVIVRGSNFRRIDYAEQRNLAAAFDCAVAGEGSHLSAIRYRNTLHGADLARFDASDLLRAREDGLPR